jgi:arginine-tRNA-protein transferase
LPRRQRCEQNFTSSQLFSQRLRQANGRLHTAQIFVGKVDFVNFSRFMLKDFPLLINEEFYAAQVSPPQLDRLLADGWRHFGEHFFRYNIGFHENDLRRVLPLRIRLKDFTPSKSQRRTLKKNQDTQTVIRPIEITAEKEILFETHKNRFKHSVPDSIYDFLSFAPAEVPCRALEVCVYQKETLLAASFFDVGEAAVSAIYAMFDPREFSRSLGIFTMLLTIEYALKNDKIFYYPGYAYEGNSFYDYKKRFSALETFDWKGNWENFESDYEIAKFRLG